jgi:hypothetical protein
MALNLYWRHRPDCEAGHKWDTRTGEFEERKKTSRKCACQQGSYSFQEASAKVSLLHPE